MGCYLTGEQFANYLVTQLPKYDDEILRTIRPTDGEYTHFEQGEWPSFSSNQHTKDRFEVVFPDLTRQWADAQAGSCIGTPCDPPQSQIGWGNTRITYGRQQISYATQLLCFDAITDQTQAVANIGQIITDILRPASSWIYSDWAKRQASSLADNKVLADTSLTPFTFSFENNGNSSIYMTTSGAPTSLLTPQMLQRLYMKTVLNGYFGETILPDMPQWVELVTDMESLWNMNEGDAAILRSNGDLASTQWRFEDFKNVGDFWKYGWSGKVGKYAVRSDPFPLRFNRISNTRYQRVFPYTNVAATNGLKDKVNDDYLNAQYQFSRITHRRGMRVLTKKLRPVNGMMPFQVRSLGGEWRFAMNNLGNDCNGAAISNYRGNKGFFYADFDLSAEPLHTEWMTTIFHKREQQGITAVAPVAADPGYPTQAYSAGNDACAAAGVVIYVTPAKSSGGDYKITANTFQINGTYIVHTAVAGSTTLAALVTELTSKLGSVGTWAVAGNGTQLSLTGFAGASVTPNWILT